MAQPSLATLLNRYLVEHSSRKINFLYWNLVNQKDNVLCFVNLFGKPLIRTNNEKLIFRVVRVKNSEDWDTIRNFLNEYIIDPNDKKAVYVINVAKLMSNINKVKSVDDLQPLQRNTFGTASIVQANKINEDEDETDDVDDETISTLVPICTIDTDVQSLYLIDNLYNKYRKLVYSSVTDWTSRDMSEIYLDQDDIKFEHNNGSLKIPIMDGLDMVSRKFIRSENPPYRIEQLTIDDGAINIVSRFTSQNVVAFTSRVYLQYFINKPKRRNNDG